MKKNLPTLLMLIASFFAVPSVGASDHASHGGHAAMHAPSAEPQMILGQIKKIDKNAGKVTISHGPLTNLGMPAMTMVFRVKDPAWLDQVKAGDKIRFMADQINGAMTVVHLERN